MTRDPRSDLLRLEGLRVGVALEDGTRLDDARLVSGGSRPGPLWLITGGVDVFVPARAVVAVWEWRPRP